MLGKIKIVQLTKEKFNEAVDIVLKADLDTREEIEHHLQHIDAHYVALDEDRIVGVIGWYQDTVNYANEAMGDIFPGPDAYWVGFFAVDETYRGKGVGYALLKKLEEVMRDLNEKKLWVSSVPQTNKYYERQGFRLIKTGKINGNLKYFMSKDL